MKLSFEIPLLDNPTLPTSEFLAAIPVHYMIDMYKMLEAYYESYSMYPILREHGVELEFEQDQQQINCSFQEHGTQDTHKSARYYLFDRDTGRKSERVYCWKCQSMATLLRYIIKQGKDMHGYKMMEALGWAEKRYGYQVPRELIRNYDTVSYFSWESNGGASQKMNMLLNGAVKARQLLLSGDKTAYIKQMRTFVFCDVLPQAQVPLTPTFENLEI